MFKLCYISQPVREFSFKELDSMLVLFRKNNHNQGITGLLLYRAQSFCQILEGEEAKVTELFRTIQTDNRHQNVVLISQGRIGSSAFYGWSMKFTVLEGSQIFSPTNLPPIIDL
jgi:hypothetical protein